MNKQIEGEWLPIKIPTGVEAYGIREVQLYPKCSICDYMGDVSAWHFKFCPNCGAKMFIRMTHTCPHNIPNLIPTIEEMKGEAE